MKWFKWSTHTLWLEQKKKNITIVDFTAVKIAVYYISVLTYEFIFFIQFNVPFKIISLIETSHSVGGAKRGHPGKTT